jgi:hypothetical protein
VFFSEYHSSIISNPSFASPAAKLRIDHLHLRFLLRAKRTMNSASHRHARIDRISILFEARRGMVLVAGAVERVTGAASQNPLHSIASKAPASFQRHR